MLLNTLLVRIRIFLIMLPRIKNRVDPEVKSPNLRDVRRDRLHHLQINNADDVYYEVVLSSLQSHCQYPRQLNTPKVSWHIRFRSSSSISSTARSPRAKGPRSDRIRALLKSGLQMPSGQSPLISCRCRCMWDCHIASYVMPRRT